MYKGKREKDAYLSKELGVLMHFGREEQPKTIEGGSILYYK